MVERLRGRPDDGADGRQDLPAGRVERAAGGPRRGVAHHRRAAGRVRTDLPGRPQRDAGHPAPGAAADPARGTGAVGHGVRDHAHAGAAGRAGVGVPHGPAVGRELGLGRRAGPRCPSCWPRSCRRPRCERGPTTSSSTRRTSGSPSTSPSGTPPSSTAPSATRRPTPGPPSPPSTSWARSPTGPPSCT